MTDPKTAARTVAARLSEKQISIKHVQALDLVAAGCGYQDRSKLSALDQLPALKKVNIKLLTSAATILAKHDLDRRQTIVDTTTNVLIPNASLLTTQTPADLPALSATVRLDDGSRTVSFNAAPVLSWFAPSSIIELISPNSSEDDLIEIDATYPDPASVRITDEFQFALAKLGWTTSQWRDHTKSKMASHLSGTRPARGTGHSFAGDNSGSKGPLISLEKLVEIIENGCTNYFGIVLYGIVPLQDLIDLDLSRPMAFERAHIAVYNAYAGTFMDTNGPEGRIVVEHGVDGKLNGNLGASPAEFCGLATSYYETRLTDPEVDDHKRSASQALRAVISEVPFVPGDDHNKGMKLRYPGHSIYWEYGDDTRQTLISPYGIGVANRYDREYRQIKAIYDIATGEIAISDHDPKTNA